MRANSSIATERAFSLPPPLPAPSVPLGINLVVVDSDASMLGDESGDTDSEEDQLFMEMIVKLSAAAAPDPVHKFLLTAKAEELTRTNKAREARASRLQQPLQPASASQLNRHNRDEVITYIYNNGNATRFRRLGRSASSPSLCLTIRLTEMNIKRYVENVIRRSVLEGTLTSDSSSPERSRPIATEP